MAGGTDPSAGQYDLVFTDTWPSKYTHLTEALSLVATAGLYVIDDLLPQASWPDEHHDRVDNLLARLSLQTGWVTAPRCGERRDGVTKLPT